MGDSTYRIRSTGYSSGRYGGCEVCGEHASEVFIRSETEAVKDSGGTFDAVGDTTFGHRDCLTRTASEARQ